MENKNGNTNIFLIIITIIVVIIAIYFIFFNNNMPGNLENNNGNNSVSNTVDNVANSTKDIVSDTVNIVDENAKSLYNRVKTGITIDGKVIEVPANYIKKITNKVTKEGYKMTDETKNAINSKLDEIENIVRSEGKTDIKDLSDSSQSKIKSIASDIENML